MAYRTVYKEESVEIEIKKSRFIGHIKPCKNVEEAENFIAGIKEDHKQATHNCSAYIVGPDGIQQKYSDDGEPQGTAGIPILEVLKKEELTNVCVVVTRYFGGVKLGASGLVRAYTRSCREALEAGKIVTYKSFTQVYLKISYSVLGNIEYYMQTEDIFESDRRFSDNVEMLWYILNEDLAKVKADILNMTSASLDWKIGEEKHLPVDKNNKVLGI